MIRGLALGALATALISCQCGQAPTRPGQRDLGAACDADDQCKSGLCDRLPGVKGATTCLKPCASVCSTGEVCVSLGLDHFACGPEREGLCRTCNSDNDCPYPEDRCLLQGLTRVCGRDCSFDGSCPLGYACGNGLSPDGNQVFAQCQPTSGTCACTPATIGQSMPCQRDNTFGHCLGAQICQGMIYAECSARVPGSEVCNGVDDDCNGMVDELGTTSCGVGECRTTVEVCVAGLPQTCTPGLPTTEICDEKDNDCDGVDDNGFDKMTSINNCGQCNHSCVVGNGTPECTAGACRIKACNPGFGDCNALYPDGCETNTQTSAQNCGSCGHVCAAPNSNSSCVGGTCLSTCQPGFVDLNGLPGDGCEYACTKTSDVDYPDLGFVDANCDGLDGELANAIFVSASGSDANAGDQAHPMRSLAAATAAAVAGNKRDVYVAAGTWLEQLSVPTGKGVYGGYLDGTWVRSTFNTATVTGVNTPLLISGASNSTVQLMTFLGGTPVGDSQSAYGAAVINSASVKLESVTIRAGNGTGGLAGAPGTSGASGGGGQLGEQGCESSGIGCNTCNQPQGGNGGVSSCGRTGGNGGLSGHDSSWGSDGSPGVGSTPGGQGSGGAGVLPGQHDNTPGPPYVGQDGADGAAGTNGTSAGPFGGLSTAGYSPAAATAGQPGGHGTAGGGGGGGGGGTHFCNSYGGGGGGGGAGGCLGTGGLPGLSGGASVALFLANSTVTATGCLLQTGNGGSGGNGGASGQGGMPGPGGVASMGAGNEYGGSGNQDDASNGGRGGNGGKGGNGGAGGAGAGGPSVAVMVTGVSSYSPINVSVTLGVGGPGGSSAAGNGASGLTANKYP